MAVGGKLQPTLHVIKDQNLPGSFVGKDADNKALKDLASITDAEEFAGLFNLSAAAYLDVNL